MLNKNTAHKYIGLYHQFLKENNVTTETVYANILWKWHDYFKTHLIQKRM